MKFHNTFLGSAAALYSCSSPNQQGCATIGKPVLTEPSLDNRQLNWSNQSNLRRSGRELRLWRSDWGDLVADQLPAGRVDGQAGMAFVGIVDLVHLFNRVEVTDDVGGAE